MNLSKMNLSHFAPSCSWNDVNIRPTKLHWSRINSRSNYYFWINQLLRELIFKSNVGKMWVQLLHALVERFSWRAYMLPSIFTVKRVSSFSCPSRTSLYLLTHIQAFPEPDTKWCEVFAKWSYHCPPEFQQLHHIRYKPAEENLLCDCRALWSAEPGPETAWWTPVTQH